VYIVKVKWLPWIFIIAGLYGLFSGEWNALLAIIVIALGGVGAYYFYGGKGSGSTPNTRPTGYHPPVEPHSAQIPAANGEKVCPNCGAPVEEGMLFCSKCGTRV
jgi:hypothetical protein